MGIKAYEMDIRPFLEAAGVRAVSAVIEGIYTGAYEICLPGEEPKEIPDVTLTGIDENLYPAAQGELKQGISLAEAQSWARNMVNAPGNLFHPMDFAREIMEHMKETSVECELIVYSKLNAMGMEALTSVGKSSENPPCMLVMRYRGAEDAPITGLVGKGVTCDRHKEVKVLSYIRPFYNINSGRMLGYVELSIPETQISGIYKQYNTTNELFLIDKNGQVQSSNGNPELDTQYEYMDLILKNLNSQYFFAGGNLLFFTPFSTLDWYVLNQIPIVSFLAPLFAMFCLSLLIAALVMVLCVFASHHIAQKVTYPLSYLISHIQTVKEGNWVPIHEIPCNDEVASLLSSFNSMIAIQTKMRDDLIEAEKLKQQLSLSLLQQQVNPHFLYNTLDNICALAELDEKETLIQLVMNLSSFYRSSLSNGKMHISIGQELEISRAYLEILQIRYFHKFDFTITCPEALKNYSCIKLLLQPILENSIYHGIKGLDRHGILHIEAEDTGDCIRFTISDNGRGFSKEDYEKIWQQDADHFGIKSTQQRILLYYGPDYGLSMQSPQTGGCITMITLPKQEGLPCH